MKPMIIRCILLVFALSCLGCAAAHTPAEREAINRAESVFFPEKTPIKPDDVFKELIVIIPQRDLRVLRVDGVTLKGSMLDEQAVFLAPGRHVLTFSTDPNLTAWRKAMSGADSKTRETSTTTIITDDVAVVVGNKRHHILDYEKSGSGTEIVFRQLTGVSEQEVINKYLRDHTNTDWMTEKLAAAQIVLDDLAAYQTFARANPDWLEGKWAVSADELEDMLEFSGNSVRYTAAKSFLISTRNTLEGTFMFDQDTIVILWNSITTFLNSVTREENPGFFPKTAWIYRRNGDTLEVKSNGLLIPAEIGGTYQKIR